jgi:hypothetical protein
MKKFFACRIESWTAIDTILLFEPAVLLYISFPVSKAILKNKFEEQEIIYCFCAPAKNGEGDWGVRQKFKGDRDGADYSVSSNKKHFSVRTEKKLNSICFECFPFCFMKPPKIGLFRCFEPASKQPK